MKKEYKDLFCLYKILTEDASQFNPIPLQMIYFKAIEKYNVNLSFDAIKNGLKEFSDGMLGYTLVGNDKDGYYLQSKTNDIIIQGKDRLTDYEIEEAIKTIVKLDFQFKDKIIDKLIYQANEDYKHILRQYVSKEKEDKN